MLYRLLLISFTLSLGVTSKIWAQASFSEGTLVYRIDTVRRLETQPSQYRATQFKLYMKADLIRAETLYINRFDSTDWQRMIEIRNQKGIYTILEEKPSIPIDSLVKELSIPKDSLLKALPWLDGFAQFISYEEEKLNRSNGALQGLLTIYTAKQTGKKSTVLSMPTEQLVLISSGKGEPMDVQITHKLNAPVGLFFEPLRKIEGTPLQFANSQYGWLYQYTIDSVNSQSLPNELFQIDPNLRILTADQIIQEVHDLIK